MSGFVVFRRRRIRVLSLIAPAVLLISCGLLPRFAHAEVADAPAAVTAAAEAAAAPGPNEVIVGAYVNDIQEIDFRTHSYAVDLYVWLRWKNAAITPDKTLEFMNRYAPNDHVRDMLYEKPKIMPDGSFYSAIRAQGRFATKFRLEKYPFDTQNLIVTFEDSLAGSQAQIYVPDANPITLNPDVLMPGFRIGKPQIVVVDKPYATNFGDLSEPDVPSYSRVTIVIPISRPLAALSAKTFLPIGLIVVCALLVFFVRPAFADGRIGLAITALLTLVALQLTSGSSLPDVDYLMMIDKIYFASYVFIIAALVRVVATSWVSAGTTHEVEVARRDRMWAMGLAATYVVSVLVTGWWALRI